MMRLIGFVILFANSFLFSEKAFKLHYIVQDKYFQNLPSPFSPLEQSEAETDWGKEARIGLGLAKEFDLYRAVTAFKRARLLAPDPSRQREIEYSMLLSYYLGKRYKEIDTLFTKGTLDKAGPDFSPFHDLLVILYDTYKNLEEETKTAQLLQLISYHYPKTHTTLLTYEAFKNNDLTALASYAPEFVAQYQPLQKSPKKAALFNAFFPGLGYYYIGLKNTAITAFFLNVLSIAACITFFRRRAIAAGLITLSFAIGWYVGGIQGGLSKTTFYNEQTYEALANPLMNREGIFPIHLLCHGF